MAHYLYTKHTVSQRICYAYRCSHCGMPLYGAIGFETSVNYDTRGWTKNGSKRKAEKAHNEALEVNSSFIDETISQAMAGDYRNITVKSRCSNCGHREPWQRMYSYSIVKVLLRIICIVAVFALIMNEYKHKELVCGIGVALVVTLAIALIVFCQRRKMNIMCATLPEVSLPHFCFSNDKESIIQALKEIEFRKNEQLLEVANSYS